MKSVSPDTNPQYDMDGHLTTSCSNSLSTFSACDRNSIMTITTPLKPNAAMFTWA